MINPRSGKHGRENLNIRLRLGGEGVLYPETIVVEDAMNVPAATFEPRALYAFDYLLELKFELLKLPALKVLQFGERSLQPRAHIGGKHCLLRDHVGVHCLHCLWQ